MAKVLPFAPMPLPVLKTMSAPFARFSANTSKMFPRLRTNLQQANLDMDEKEYGAIMIFLVLFYTVFFSVLITLLLSKIMEYYLPMGIGIGLFMGLMMFIQVVMYPQIIVRKKIRNIEKNLVFALRAILVQLKSGISLFDSMTMVSKGNYGAVGKEFQKAIESINAGVPEQDALEEMGKRNPSPYLGKAIWQIVNGMNAGADISDVLGETVSTMLREQKLAINRYGSQLRILSLMYMMIGVIMPALGVTLLIILFTFPMVGDAVGNMPVLKDTTEMLKGFLPGETYLEGDFITGLGGKQEYTGEQLTIKVDTIEGRKGVFSLQNNEGKNIETQSVYGEGSNLREYFATEDKREYFGESLEIKSIGTNIFGQGYVEITRIETAHLVFWGLLAMVSIMQFMYIGIIKSRRPNIIG